MRISFNFNISPFNRDFDPGKYGVISVTEGSSIEWQLMRSGTLIHAAFSLAWHDVGDHNLIRFSVGLFTYEFELTWYSHKHYGE